MSLQFLSLSERPELKEYAADWFHNKWGVSKEAYLKCMDAYLSGDTEYGWYICLNEDKLLAVWVSLKTIFIIERI